MGSHCVDCAKAARPDLATRARFWSAGQHTLVTMSLIAINVGVFLAVLLWSQSSGALTGSITEIHARFGVSRGVIADGGLFRTAGGEILVFESGGWYRLLTSGFLHYGVIHLAFNMYFIYVIGPLLERPLGRIRYLLLYLASLLGGSLGVIVIDQGGIAAGASGAAFGLMAAVAVGMYRRGINPFSTGIGTILLLNLGITFFVPGISIGGHLGGAAAGAACAAIMMAPGHQPIPRWVTYATPAVVGVASVVLSVLIVNAT